MNRDDGRTSGGMVRFLRLFTDVRTDEVPTLLLLTTNVYLLLTAYYIIKPVREALILGSLGAEVKAYASVGQVAVLAVTVPLYAWIASRVPRQTLITGVTSFFAACLVVFYGLARMEFPLLGIVFFLWVGVFNVVVIAQFWSFANDVYNRSEGERLFAVVAFGAAFGAVSGAWITGRLIDLAGVHQMMLLAAAVLVSTLALVRIVDRRERERLRQRRSDSEPSKVPDTLLPGGAFRLIAGNRYLLLLALVILFLNLVNTTGEYILGRVVEAAAKDAVMAGDVATPEEFIGEFYSGFFTAVNLLALLFQLFAVSRIIRFLGMGVSVAIVPFLSVGAYTLLAFQPVLSWVRTVKIIENGTNYSLENTVRNALFLPTSREAKYKAKQAIDTFFHRTGDVLSGGLVYAGTNWLTFDTAGFAATNLVLAATWLGVSVAAGIRYKRIGPTDGIDPGPGGSSGHRSYEPPK